MAEKLCKSCCLSRSRKRYIKGKENVEHRLDIVKLAKTSLDLEILLKLKLLPK